MSLDYHLRLDRSFTVEQLVTAALAAWAELEPAAEPRELVVVSGLDEYLARHADAERAGRAVLDSRYGEAPGIGPDIVVMTPGSERVVQVSEFDHGSPEDAELGRRLSVEVALDRTKGSRLLAVAVAVGAARLTGAAVVDELGTLTGRRVSDPDLVVRSVAGRDPIGPIRHGT